MLSPYAFALAEVALPVVVLAVAARALRGRGWAARAAAVVASFGALGAAFWSLTTLRHYSPYDVLLPPLLVALVLPWIALRGRRAEATPRVVLVASAALLALGLVGLEAVARRRPEGMIRAQPVRLISTRFNDRDRDFGFLALYPDPDVSHSDAHGFPWGFSEPERWPRRPGVARVLHIGDSLTASAELPIPGRFESLLSASLGAEHLNLGMSSVSTDFELQVARLWIERLRPDEVVLHVYEGNDIYEIDRPYVYCDDGPLLGPTAAGLPWRCPTPRLRVSRRRLLAQGPCPTALRVLAPHSALAHRLLGGCERAIRGLAPHADAQESDARWGRFADMLEGFRVELARRRIPLHVVIIPHRPGVSPPDPQRSADFFAFARSVGLEPVTPLDDFRRAVAARPDGRWFFSQSPHFDADGQAVYAAFLARTFWPRRAAP